MKHIRPLVTYSAPIILLLASVGVFAARRGNGPIYLPIIAKPESEPEVLEEFRGMWVTRFDWTTYGQPAEPSRIDQIIQDASTAGFNAIFFQVRGTADAFYQPGPEPWASRVSGGVLGQPPPDNRWEPWGDPLAYFIHKAHAQGIQLHAYINVYPVWDDCDEPPPLVSPSHFYYQLESAHGSSDGKLNGLQWNTGGEVACGTYQRATPVSSYADSHYLAVAQYLADNYELDGLHLDHIRYGAGNTSCDPVSEAASGVPCFTTPPPGYSSYEAWQRAQVNGTVWKFYDQILQNNPDLWLSAAVWPIYYDYWGWGINTGYSYYYQDSKAWILGGYIDSISPMIYGSSFWNQGVWQTLVTNFQADSGGRFIIPGIGANFDDFSEIEARINMGRQIGTAGHAIFSYGQLKAHEYFDDLAAGPYSEPASVPQITWRSSSSNTVSAEDSQP
jgi:uncharacterized lipoprotein YddW (UPF0748 family)